MFEQGTPSARHRETWPSRGGHYTLEVPQARHVGNARSNQVNPLMRRSAQPHVGGLSCHPDDRYPFLLKPISFLRTVFHTKPLSPSSGNSKVPSLSSNHRASSSACRLVAMTPAVPAPNIIELAVVCAVTPVAPLRMLAVSGGEPTPPAAAAKEVGGGGCGWDSGERGLVEGE